MTGESINKMSNKKELREGRMYFVKTEPINSNLTYDEDEGNHREADEQSKKHGKFIQENIKEE